MSAILVPLLVPLEESRAYSQASYVTESALPAVVLVYSRIDYSGTFYVPWVWGAEAYTVTRYVSSMGSGFFVNPNGYLVTNGHVVFCFVSKDFKDDSVTRSYIIQDAVYALLSWCQEQYGVTFTQSDIQVTLDYNAAYGQIRESYRSTYVILGEAQGNVIEAKRGVSATVVNAEPFLGRDLAILKVELSNTPSLLLGDSDRVKTGDTVYAFGYPGVVAFHQQLSQSTLLAPSVTQGIVSGKRLTQQDILAIQHSAPVTHGNSGGPLLGEDGKVVGVNNMGSITELGLEVAGFNFAVASNVLADFLRENGVANSVGGVTLQFQRGLAFYYAGMYASAKKEFDAVTTLFPYQWRAAQLSQECQAAISRGERASSSITASVSPATVKAKKEAVTVSGYVRHASEMPVALNFSWPAAQITVQYTRPDGSTVTRAVLNSPEGTFADTFTPDVAGRWSITAFWQGDEDHAGATSSVLTFDAAEPTVLEAMAENGTIYAIPAAFVAAVAAVLVRRRSKTGNPPPPPPS
ncbi:MAG: trypsin-like peptidase domain-containing protein [Thermoproteota archaeon]